MKERKRLYDEKKFLELYYKGLNACEIASSMGVTDGAIYHWRKRLGLSPCAPHLKNGKKPLNQGKVDRIRDQIANGTYVICSANIADCLISGQLKNIVYRDIENGTTTRH